MSLTLNDIISSDEAEALEASTEINSVSTIATSSHDVRIIASRSIDMLGALAMGSAFKYLFPPVFKAVWDWLLKNEKLERAFPKLALGLPRGFGKTSVCKLFVLYCILFTDRKFILICCNTQPHALNVIKDICGYLDNPNIINTFGNWNLGKTKDTLDLKVFAFRGRTVILHGVGAGSAVRGININDERPDVMVFEDIQSRADADSKTISDDLLTWMVGTAMKAKSPFGCMYIFIANMYPTPNSILKKLKSNPEWVKFICGGILADGTSLWEQLQPIKQLILEYLTDVSMGLDSIFAAEVLNDEDATPVQRINYDLLEPCDIAPYTVHAGNFVLIDPGGQKETADKYGVGYFEMHDQKPTLMDGITGNMTPLDVIKNAIKLCLKYNCTLICVESNAYQNTLCFWFTYICSQLNVRGLNIREVYSGKESKITRIIKMLQQYQKNEIAVNKNMRPIIHSEIRSFNPKINNTNTDNMLDVLTYASKVVAMYGDLMVSNTYLSKINESNIDVDANNCVYEE